jgi:hypothetical protein
VRPNSSRVTLRGRLAQLAELGRMSVEQLATKYRTLYGEPTRTRNEGYLWKRLDWCRENGRLAQLLSTLPLSFALSWSSATLTRAKVESSAIMMVFSSSCRPRASSWTTEGMWLSRGGRDERSLNGTLRTRIQTPLLLRGIPHQVDKLRKALLRCCFELSVHLQPTCGEHSA